MIRYFFALCGALLCASAATAQDPSVGGKAAGTGRELYVACFLFAADAKVENQVGLGGYVLPYSPPACLTTAVAMMAMANPNKNNGDMGCYTIQDGPLTSAQWPKEMARTYVRFYEKNAEKLANVMGVSALLIALTREWPCK